jgi:hypothetical protein
VGLVGEKLFHEGNDLRGASGSPRRILWRQLPLVYQCLSPAKPIALQRGYFRPRELDQLRCCRNKGHRDHLAGRRPPVAGRDIRMRHGLWREALPAQHPCPSTAGHSRAKRGSAGRGDLECSWNPHHIGLRPHGLPPRTQPHPPILDHETSHHHRQTRKGLPVAETRTGGHSCCPARRGTVTGRRFAGDINIEVR